MDFAIILPEAYNNGNKTLEKFADPLTLTNKRSIIKHKNGTVIPSTKVDNGSRRTISKAVLGMVSFLRPKIRRTVMFIDGFILFRSCEKVNDKKGEMI